MLVQGPQPLNNAHDEAKRIVRRLITIGERRTRARTICLVSYSSDRFIYSLNRNVRRQIITNYRLSTPLLTQVLSNNTPTAIESRRRLQTLLPVAYSHTRSTNTHLGDLLPTERNIHPLRIRTRRADHRIVARRRRTRRVERDVPKVGQRQRRLARRKVLHDPLRVVHAQRRPLDLLRDGLARRLVDDGHRPAHRARHRDMHLDLLPGRKGNVPRELLHLGVLGVPLVPSFRNGNA